MKKLIAMLTAVLFVTPVFAEETGSEYYVKFEYTDGLTGACAAAAYDSNNRLFEVSLCEAIIGDKVCSAQFSMEHDNKDIRIYFPETGTVIKEFLTFENGFNKPNIPEKKPEDNNTDAASKYPTALDAATAFMVVKDAGVSAEGTDVKTVLKVFFRGEETELVFDEDMTISSAPPINDDLIGEPVSALKEGDVIYCSTNMSGKILTAELICRPPESDIIMQETGAGINFGDIFSGEGFVTSARPTPIAVYGGDNSGRQQYAFGLIKEKGSGYMALCNKSGIADRDIEIELSDETVVYVYDNEKRKDRAYIGSAADIYKSEFDKASLDDEDNVIEWNGDLLHNYALVRMANGVALDIVVYLNY